MLRRTTEEEKKSLQAFSFSRLTDLAQCPTWGVVHSQKQYAQTARSMALEAGSAMHEVFAAIRIWQLEHIQGLPLHAKAVAKRIFGLDRWKQIKRVQSEIDSREGLLEVAFNALHTCGWVDDPNDNNRTMSNMESAAIVYVDERLPNMENWPIYVASEKEPSSLVGVEQVFDIVLVYEDGYKVRYIGTVDGLVTQAATGKYYIDENKTANRLDTGWRASFDLSHQITGYVAASTTTFGFPVFRSRVTGLKIKPTQRGEDVIAVEPLERTSDNVRQWAKWVRDRAEVYDRYKDNYEDAPRFTHSCNRYFRPCALSPFCGDSVDGRKEQWDEMVVADRSPSEQAIMEN